MPRQYAEPHHQSSTSSSVHLDTNQANTRFIKRNSPSLQELLPTSFEGSPPDIELTPPADPVHDDTMKHTVYLTICTPRPFLGTDDDRPTFHHQSSPHAWQQQRHWHSPLASLSASPVLVPHTLGAAFIVRHMLFTQSCGPCRCE
jgi:hypothetical protein